MSDWVHSDEPAKDLYCCNIPVRFAINHGNRRITDVGDEDAIRANVHSDIKRCIPHWDVGYEMKVACIDHTEIRGSKDLVCNVTAVSERVNRIVGIFTPYGNAFHDDVSVRIDNSNLVTIDYCKEPVHVRVDGKAERL